MNEKIQERIKSEVNKQQTLDLILEEIKSLKNRVDVLEKEMKTKARKPVIMGGGGPRR